ncbi:hypothetical protein Tco_1438321 [Tanacetum coccineum]
MSGSLPPMLLALGANTGNSSSPIRTGNPTDDINNINPNNMGQNVMDENLPQLLDSRGGSHVTNVLEFDKEDFSTLYGKYNYKEGLIDQIYKSEPPRFTTQASTSKALISDPSMHDSDFDIEEDQRSNRVITFKALMAVADEELSAGRTDARALGGKGMRKEKISSKEVVFTKSDISTSKTYHEVPYDSELEGNTQRPIPALHKLIGAEPSDNKKFVTITKTK